MSSQIIINPQTQRPVKVGSRTWRKLVADGLIQAEGAPTQDTLYPNGASLYTIRDDDADLESKIREINSELPSNVHAVRGRGRYAGQIVRRRRQPPTADVARQTIRKTASKLRNRDVYDTLHEGDFSADLEALIMQELGANTGAYEEDEEAGEVGGYKLSEGYKLAEGYNPELAEVSDESDESDSSECYSREAVFG